MTPHSILVTAAAVAFLLSGDTIGTQDNCDRSKCQTSGLISLYSELNCMPEYQESTCCPVRYDCSSYSSRNANKCHFKGDEYEINSEIPTNVTSRNCMAACRCVGRTSRPVEFVCAQIECAEFFGVPLPHTSCIRQYSPNSCCSVSTYCPQNKTAEEEEIFQCEYEGKKYLKGQRFYPNDECKRCICDENFDGTTSGSWCTDISCGVELRSSHYLHQGCAPVFYKSQCCPIQWHCPSNDDSVIEGPNNKVNNNNTAEMDDDKLTCTFGNLKLHLQDKLKPGQPANVDCACIVPPYLSCELKSDA